MTGAPRIKASDPARLRYAPLPSDIDPARAAARRKWQRAAIGFVLPALLLASWQIAATTGMLDERLFSSPRGMIGELGPLLSQGSLPLDIAITVGRVLGGYAVGAGCGIVLALLVGRFALARAAVLPTVSAFYTVPKLGIYPLLLLIFGLGELPRFVLVALGTFLIVFMATVDAVRNVESSYLEVAAVFKASRRARFFEVILPAVLPQVFSVLRLAIGLGLLVVIATEFVAAREGLGFMIWNSWNTFQPVPMYVGLVCSAVLGVIGSAAITLVERVAMPWAATSGVSRTAV
jgi:NitT/TauT family transport system permease protein/sulfonate transport system permease protein